MLLLCRPPRGGRGLKSYIGSGWITGNASPPSRGAWIEIILWPFVGYHRRSPPSRGAWIEINRLLPLFWVMWSPPSRGAWIEILILKSVTDVFLVAPLAGGVD